MVSDSNVTREELLIPTGTDTISAARYSAVGTKSPNPTLLMSIPYRKDDYITYGGHDPTIQYLARHGYDVVVSDLVGTGSSSGLKEKFTAFQEGEATDLIDWLAEQNWSTGAVGMFGQSYGGRTCLNAAAERPDPLKAIIPVETSALSYDHAKYQGGTINFHKQGRWGPQMQAFAALPSGLPDADGRGTEVWKDRLDRLDDSTPWLFQMLEHDTKDQFWRELDVDVEKIDVPTFGISGWRDYYPQGTLEQIPSIDAPTRILMGPWRHTRPHQGRETAVDFRAQAVEWFDYFLKGEQNGALDHPPIEYWTERYGGGKIDGGTWRSRESWPSAVDSFPGRDGSTENFLEFSLTPDGLTRLDEFTDGTLDTDYEFDHTVGIDSLDYVSPPTDTSADDARSLCFETPSVTEPVEFTGTGVAKIRLQPETKDCMLAVRIVDVDPSGSASLVTYGRILMSKRNGLDEEAYLTPGDEYDVDVELKPVSHIFESGHRIRVAISAAFFPLNLAPPEQGSFTILSDPEAPSVVQFPGRYRKPGFSFDDTINMNPPDTASYPTTSKHVTSSEGVWETSRDHRNDSATFLTESHKEIQLPHGATMEFHRAVQAKVEADNPLTSKIETDIEVSIDYGFETINVTGQCQMSHGSASISETVHIDEQKYYEKTWTY